MRGRNAATVLLIAVVVASCRTYEFKGAFSEGLAAVCVRDSSGDFKWGFVDRTGAMVVPALYDRASPFSEGLACVRVRDSVLTVRGKQRYRDGYIDRHGNMIIQPGFRNAQAFTEGRARVSDEHGRVGFIATNGSFVVACRYAAAEPFGEGRAFVLPDRGRELRDDVMDESTAETLRRVGRPARAGDKTKKVVETGTWGIIDLAGNEVVAPTYDGPSTFRNGKADVAVAGRRFAIDRDGKVLAEKK